MSRGRMEDLLVALKNDGWRLLDHREYPRASRDPFELESDTVTWAIVRGDSPTVIELEFVAFGDFGERTGQLLDILYCQVNGTSDSLLFVKRVKPEWRENVAKFVHGLKQRTEH